MHLDIGPSQSTNDYLVKIFHRLAYALIDTRRKLLGTRMADSSQEWTPNFHITAASGFETFQGWEPRTLVRLPSCHWKVNRAGGKVNPTLFTRVGAVRVCSLKPMPTRLAEKSTTAQRGVGLGRRGVACRRRAAHLICPGIST